MGGVARAAWVAVGERHREVCIFRRPDWWERFKIGLVACFVARSNFREATFPRGRVRLAGLAAAEADAGKKPNHKGARPN